MCSVEPGLKNQAVGPIFELQTTIYYNEHFNIKSWKSVQLLGLGSFRKKGDVSSPIFRTLPSPNRLFNLNDSCANLIG